MKWWQRILVILLGCGIWLFNIMPALAAVNVNLEKSILEIIDKHPEAILKSLSAYQRQQREQQTQAQVQVFEQVRQQLPQLLEHSPVLGDRQSAAVTLIEFADFECPFCIQAHLGLKQLCDRFPTLAFAYKNLPLADIHPQSIPAAKAAWAAGRQGKFWQYHDALYETEKPLDEAVYLKIAKKSNLDLSRFNRDRQSIAASQAIAQDLQLAAQLQITGTPFFLAISSTNIEAVSGVDFERLESILDQAIPRGENDFGS